MLGKYAQENLIKNRGLEEFEKYYEKLFSHEGLLDSEEDILIKSSVIEYYSNNKEKKFDIKVSEELINACLKKLQNNKAVGHDSICNEFL